MVLVLGLTLISWNGGSLDREAAVRKAEQIRATFGTLPDGKKVGPGDRAVKAAFSEEENAYFIDWSNGMVNVRKTDGRCNIICFFYMDEQSSWPTGSEVGNEVMESQIERFAQLAGFKDVTGRILSRSEPRSWTSRLDVNWYPVMRGFRVAHPHNKTASFHAADGRLISIGFSHIPRPPEETEVRLTAEEARRIMVGELLKRGVEDFEEFRPIEPVIKLKKGVKLPTDPDERNALPWEAWGPTEVAFEGHFGDRRHHKKAKGTMVWFKQYTIYVHPVTGEVINVHFEDLDGRIG